VARNPSDIVLFVLKRLVFVLPVLLGVIAITFILTHFEAADPCAIWEPRAKPSVLAACRTYYGLGQPVPYQFWKYLTSITQGNWGVSPDLGNAPVLPAILAGVPATLELIIASLILMILIGIPLGVVAAVSNGHWADHLVRIFYLSGWATPTYLGGVLLAVFVGPAFGLPTKGDFTGTPPFRSITGMPMVDALLAGDPGGFVNAFSHVILPATALAFLNMGIATRMTRTAMLEVLPLDYVKTARMKGLSEFRTVYRHALRNALITTVTVLGITAGTLLSGTVVIEEIFSWPGIGDYAFSAITHDDIAGTIAVVIIFAIGVIIANLAADLLYGVLDPRVEWR
jgi:ABC-type dipeptide/oligopeptide/nickel transport system permease component